MSVNQQGFSLSGVNVIAGIQWYHGSGVPSDTLGVNNDLYLDDLTSDYYQKSAGTWGSPVGNLKGLEGDKGDQGDKGDKGDTGNPGQGVPTGGSANQYLEKIDGTNYNTQWTTPPFIKNYQDTISTLAPSGTWNITHASDASFKRVVQIWKERLFTNTSLDFDTADESSFTQENSSMTSFLSNKLQLEASTAVTCYAHWSLNESSGSNVPDSSGNSRNGTTQNSPTWTSGKINNCLQFNGSNQYIDCGNIANFERTQACSYEFWFKNSGENKQIMSRYDSVNVRGTSICVNVSGTIMFLLATDSTHYLLVQTTSSGYNNNTWHHVIVTYDGSSNASGVNIWIDGSDKALTTVQNNLNSGITISDNFFIGKTSQKTYYDGYLDEILIYETKLNSTEVANRWNSGNGTEGGINYDTSQGWYVTTNTNQINTSTWNSISALDFTQTTPTDTQLKYLLSVDGKTTWKKWTGSAWASETLANIHTNGNSKTTLEALLQADFDLLFSSGTLDIAIGLKTTVATSTPELDLITITYSLIGYNKCKDSELDIECIDSTTTRVTNITANAIDYLRANIDF